MQYLVWTHIYDFVKSNKYRSEVFEWKKSEKEMFYNTTSEWPSECHGVPTVIFYEFQYDGFASTPRVITLV